MKRQAFLHFAIAALCAAQFAALAGPEQETALESDNGPDGWRFSAGFRAAPGIKTKASIDARAAAAAAGRLARLSGGRSSSAPGSRSSVTEDLGSETTGTTADEVMADAGYKDGVTRYDFGNGDFIDLNDGENAPPGETANWHFNKASVFEDGAIRIRQPYSSTTTSRTRTTETETTSARASTSFREVFADDLRDSSDETARGVELRIDRSLWQDERFGVDFGIGYTWYGELDVYSIRGRAYSASASATSSKAEATTRTRTTETETKTTESGNIVTAISQPDFDDIADMVNRDGSIGAGMPYAQAETSLPSGYKTPIITVTRDNFSTYDEPNPAKTETSSKTTGEGASKAAAPSGGSRTKKASRTVDVRSDGTLSLQELRIGFRPYWQATDWLALRADLGLLTTYSEIETDTRIYVNGAQTAAISKEKDDWTFSGYAGLAVSAALTSRLELSLGAEARFPNQSLRFDDGIASGKIDLARWSASAALCFRF